MFRDTSIEPRAFDKQPRSMTASAQLLELPPEATCDHGAMKILDGLSLHQRCRPDEVIAGGKNVERDVGSELAEYPCNA